VLRVIAVQCKHAFYVIFIEFFEQYAAGFEHCVEWGMVAQQK
jgi:hypothetical protein